MKFGSKKENLRNGAHLPENLRKAPLPLPVNCQQQQEEVSYKQFLFKLAREKTYNEDETEILGFIPCLYLDSNFNSSKILVFFHGNGEDIQQSFDLMNHIRNNFRVRASSSEPQLRIQLPWPRVASSKALI